MDKELYQEMMYYLLKVMADEEIDTDTKEELFEEFSNLMYLEREEKNHEI